MLKHSKSGLGLASLSLGLGLLSPMVVHGQAMRLPTSKDAFMHVQYNTADELADALAKDAHARKAIAKHFKLSEAALVEYVRTNLVLTTTKSTFTGPNYGLTPKNYMYYKMTTFKPGLKVWATRDGKPVLKWICTNPIVFKLPPAPVAVAKVVEKPKPVVVEKPTPPPPPPPVVEKPKPVVVEKPTPPPVVVEKPKPVVVEKPKPVVVEKPTPPPVVVEKPKPVVVVPPPVVVTPPPPVVTRAIDPCDPAVSGNKKRPRLTLMGGTVGFDQPAYDKMFSSTKSGIFQAGFDLLRTPRTATGLFMDYTQNSHGAFCAESLGVGLQKRIYTSCEGKSNRSYYGFGVGSYKTLYLAHPNASIGRPTSVGGKIFLGKEIGRNAFLELGRQFIGSQTTIAPTTNQKINLNNTYLGAGFRF